MADDDSMPVVDSAEEQLALNESTFRDVNEAIESGRGEREGLVPFVCECGRLGCAEVIEMTIAEYERVRGSGRRFAVLPGHVDPAVEHVVLEGDGYVVVEKHGDAAAAAEDLDPRA